jgi:hypothetical protein
MESSNSWTVTLRGERLNISNQLSARIAEWIESYSKSESATPELRELVEQEKVLPICSDMGGVFAVDTNGEIRSFLWDDTLHGKLEFDPRIRNLALFQGSKKYPELASLIVKPEDARVCPHCEGTGRDPYAGKLNRDSIACYCGGLGWLP